MVIKTGQNFKSTINGHWTEGKILVSKFGNCPAIYLCQNDSAGLRPREDGDFFGYLYTYLIPIYNPYQSIVAYAASEGVQNLSIEGKKVDYSFTLEGIKRPKPKKIIW